MPRRKKRHKESVSRKGASNAPSKGRYPEYAPVMVVAALEGFGVGLVMPLLVPIARNGGANPGQVGVLSSIYGLIQLFAAPYAGTAASGWDKPAVLGYSLYIVGVSYAVLGTASSRGSLGLFVASRVITGVFKHSSMLQRAIVAEMDVDQTEALGRMSFAPIVGFATAPLVGGFLTDNIGPSIVCFLSATVFAVNGLFVQTVLANRKGAKKSGQAEQSKKQSGGFVALWKSFKQIPQPTLRALSVRLAIGIALGIFWSAQAWLLEEDSSITATDKGKIRTLSSITAGLTGAFVVKPVKQLAGSNMRVALLGLVLDTAAISLLIFSPGLDMARIASIAVPFSSMIMSTGMVALLNASVGENEKGLILGLTDSVLAVAYAVTPGLSGLLLNYLGVRASLMTSVALGTTAVISLASSSSSDSRPAVKQAEPDVEPEPANEKMKRKRRRSRRRDSPKLEAKSRRSRPSRESEYASSTDSTSSSDSDSESENDDEEYRVWRKKGKQKRVRRRRSPSSEGSSDADSRSSFGHRKVRGHLGAKEKKRKRRKSTQEERRRGHRRENSYKGGRDEWSTIAKIEQLRAEVRMLEEEVDTRNHMKRRSIHYMQGRRRSDNRPKRSTRKKHMRKAPLLSADIARKNEGIFKGLTADVFGLSANPYLLIQWAGLMAFAALIGFLPLVGSSMERPQYMPRASMLFSEGALYLLSDDVPAALLGVIFVAGGAGAAMAGLSPSNYAAEFPQLELTGAAEGAIYGVFSYLVVRSVSNVSPLNRQAALLVNCLCIATIAVDTSLGDPNHISVAGFIVGSLMALLSSSDNNKRAVQYYSSLALIK